MKVVGEEEREGRKKRRKRKRKKKKPYWPASFPQEEREV